MTSIDLAHWLALPIGLGLFGFIEPCSIGSTLLFIKSLEGREAAGKLAQVIVFMMTRALFMGALGLAAVALGTAFLGFQKVAWIVFGVFYAMIGVLYVAGRSGSFVRTLGPSLTRLSSVNGSAALGALFAFNIPACAGPLLLALLGFAAASGAGGGAPFAIGFISLALFGLALSLPIVVAASFPRAERALDWLAGLSRRIPIWTGVVLIVLGLWSVWFGLYVSVGKAI